MRWRRDLRSCGGRGTTGIVSDLEWRFRGVLVLTNLDVCALRSSSRQYADIHGDVVVPLPVVFTGLQTVQVA